MLGFISTDFNCSSEIPCWTIKKISVSSIPQNHFFMEWEVDTHVKRSHRLTFGNEKSYLIQDRVVLSVTHWWDRYNGRIYIIAPFLLLVKLWTNSFCDSLCVDLIGSSNSGLFSMMGHGDDMNCLQEIISAYVPTAIIISDILWFILDIVPVFFIFLLFIMFNPPSWKKLSI